MPKKRTDIELLKLPNSTVQKLPPNVRGIITEEGSENLDTNTYNLRRVVDRIELEVKVKKLALELLSLDETEGTVQTLVHRYAETRRALEVEQDRVRALEAKIQHDAKQRQLRSAGPALAVHSEATR